MVSFWKASDKALWIVSFCAVFLFIRNDEHPVSNLQTDLLHLYEWKQIYVKNKKYTHYSQIIILVIKSRQSSQFSYMALL
jgi:hypothetical protein